MSSASNQDTQAPRVVQLADQLAADIDRRGLQPGERFVTAAEAARDLRVSMTLANRALQLLAQRGVIERRQRVGAVVAEGSPRSRGLKVVGVFVPERDVAAEGLLEDGVILGLHRCLPGCEISFQAAGDEGDVAALDQMLRSLGRKREPIGIVLVRSSLAAQRLAARSGLPTVVFGTCRPSVQHLDSLDRDHRSVGRALTGRVRGAGESLLVLMNERILPGDHDFLDGVTDAALAGVEPLRVYTRFLPADAEAVAATLDLHLGAAAGRRRALAVVCRSLPLAQAAARHLERLGRRSRIGVADVYGAAADAEFVTARAVEGPERQGEILAEMLVHRVANPSAAAQHRLLSVELAD